MKTYIPEERIFLSDNNLNPLRKCERSLTKSAFTRWVLRCLSSLRQQLGHVRNYQLILLKEAVLLKARTIQAVKELLSQLQSITSNKRHVVGFVLWMVGIGSLFVHLFFDPYANTHQVCRVLGFDPAQCWNGKGGAESTGWCYSSWFDYLTQIRFYLALLFWSVALPLLVPTRYSLSFIPASLLHAVGWCWIIHYSFFSHSFQTITAFPDWSIVVIALVLGFSIVIGSDYMLYWENHKKRGNWQRWPAVHKLDIDQQLKNKLFDELTDEYYRINKMI